MTKSEIDLRRGVRAAAMGIVPNEHLDEVVDLAFHACNRAFATVNEVASRASDPRVQISAMGIALSLIASEAPAKVEALQRSLDGTGMTTTLVQVGLE